MPEISSIVGQHFAFASGRIGTLQLLLLTQSDVDRMLGAHSGKEAEAILTELKLTSMIDQGIGKGEEILKAVGGWVRKEVESMSPLSKDPIFHILWLEEDAPLISYMLRNHHGLTSEISREPISGMTAYDPEALKALIEEGTEGTLPSHLIKFIKEMKNLSDITPQKIDASVAQFVANLQLKLARTSGSKEIRRYVSHRIDLINIRTAVRLLKEEMEDPQSLFLDGGTLNPKKLMSDLSQIVATVERSSLPVSLGEAVREGAEDTNVIEQGCSEVIASDIARMWNVPLTIDPLFAFAALTISQLRLLRVLLIAKRNGLSPQEVKKVLPPFLSASHYRI